MHKLYWWWSGLSEGWKIFVVGTIGTLMGPAMFRWFKQSRMRHYARMLREYCDLLKSLDSDFSHLPFHMIENKLRGLGLPFYLKTRDVIEFMEEKGWATKMMTPPNCWRIN